MKKNLRITVTGKVQGVGYRYHAKNEALQQNITGFVKNMPDGSVMVEAEGESNDLEIFIARLKTGPMRAQVNTVSVQNGEWQSYSEFYILR